MSAQAAVQWQTTTSLEPVARAHAALSVPRFRRSSVDRGGTCDRTASRPCRMNLMVRGQCHAVAVLCCFAASASQCNALRPTRRRELLVSTAAMYYKWGSVVMAPSHASLRGPRSTRAARSRRAGSRSPPRARATHSLSSTRSSCAEGAQVPAKRAVLINMYHNLKTFYAPTLLRRRPNPREDPN